MGKFIAGLFVAGYLAGAWITYGATFYGPWCAGNYRQYSSGDVFDMRGACAVPSAMFWPATLFLWSSGEVFRPADAEPSTN